MKIAIIHLSDIHVREAGDAIFERLDKLSRAIWAAALTTDRQYLVVTGDLAHSGSAEEYVEVLRLLTAIQTSASQHLSSPVVRLVTIPGNHDCDFRGELDLRATLLQGDPQVLARKTPDSGVVTELVKPQKEYFNFRLAAGEAPPSSKTLWTVDDQIDATTIRFTALNTAMASSLSERQGDLFLLEDDLERLAALPGADLAITLIHHPLNWLRATNAVMASAQIDLTSDLVLSGHQHAENAYLKQRLTGSTATFFESPVLQESGDNSTSGFRVISVDLASQQYLATSMTWDGNDYISDAPDWRPLQRNPTARHARLAFTLEFERHLDDLGVNFTHPHKDPLFLQDVFIPPELITHALREPLDDLLVRRRIDSDEALEFLCGLEKCLVLGEETSGKSALAKMLVRLLRVRGVAPLFLSGRDLRSSVVDDPHRHLRRFAEAQYGTGATDAYFQLDRSQRAIVIDDFHLIGLNVERQEAVLATLKDIAGKVFIFADSVFRFEELHREPARRVVLREFESAEIQEFGFRLRARLIERWHRVGREHTLDDHDLAQEARRSEQLVEALLGKNLLPSYPFAVLAILQLAEAGREISREAGSYGSMYEALIVRAMAEGSSASDININNAFLAALAGRMFREGREFLTAQEVEAEGRAYEVAFEVPLRLGDRLGNLRARRILVESEGHTQFHYPYMYFYFVARWFRDRVAGDPSVRDELLSMADRVYSERNTNVLVFYLALSQDLGVVNRVLSNARQIYSTHAPCDFDSDVAFLDSLFKGLAQSGPAQLPAGTAEERDRFRAGLDAGRGRGRGLPEDRDEIQYRDELEDVVKLNIALKTLQILGQFVRNFPGSLQGELKREIVEECYRLGLRALSAILSVTQSGLADLRAYFYELIKDRRASLSEAEVRRAGDEAVLWLTRACAFGMVKKVSNAVGLEELERTFEAVNVQNNTIATRLIDLSVKLDHFRKLPLAEIHDLGRDVRKNYFTLVVLRDLVQYYMRAFPVKATQRQQLLDWLGLRGPQVPYNPRRRLKG